MLIAQITDVHIGFEPGNPEEFNSQRLNQMLQHFHEGPNRPDMLVISGDLTDYGDAESYQRLAHAIESCAFPVYLGLGNHDLRDTFSAQFPQFPTVSGFVQYVVNLDGLRLIMLDTLEIGRHAGAFCDLRANWLRDRLAEAPNVPTIIIMHHPPIEVGIEWMTTDAAEPWVARFANVIDDFDNIKGIWCGHIHRPISANWRGKMITVCASTAPQVVLDLSPIDANVPDDRAMIVAEPPACTLHWWNGRDLITHFDIAESRPTLAKYDEKLQPLVRTLLDERPHLVIGDDLHSDNGALSNYPQAKAA
jgi:3',5'-cyclic-AMP phosphodiesterase